MLIGAAFIAHELRTPITLQLALAEAALADPDPNETTWRAMAEGIVVSCEQQRRFIDGLLDLTRAQRGLTRVEPVDLVSVIGRVLAAHQLCGLDTALALEPAVTTGDPLLLERLAANLVSNAIRHNIAGGRIEVSTRTSAGRALLSVANSGPRIPNGELTRLFEPFERLACGPRRCADGIGLGLAIVQSIADAHDAIITARAPAAGGLEVEVSFRL